MRKYFGTDGIRGIAGESLTADLSFKVGKALGKLLTEKKEHPKVIIGRDTRISCDMIEQALTAGLTSTGVNVMTVGTIPTPAIAYLTKTIETDSGIMISASHNPYQDNGIKIFGPDGFKLTDDQELEIEHLIDNSDEIKNASYEQIGKLYSGNELSQKYIQHIKQSISGDLSGIKIALDCANGATTGVAPFIFGDLEADIETIGCKPNGININDNVGSTKINTIANFVKENNVDVGFAFDGDGDRVLAVDSKGNIVDGDRGFGNICCDNNLLFPERRGLKHPLLLFLAQAPVQRQRIELAEPRLMREPLDTVLNRPLSGQEHEDRAGTSFA